MADLWSQYQQHAQSWYTKGGRPTSRQSIVRAVGLALVTLDGNRPAASIGVAELRAVRERLLLREARKSIND